MYIGGGRWTNQPSNMSIAGKFGVRQGFGGYRRKKGVRKKKELSTHPQAERVVIGILSGV